MKKLLLLLLAAVSLSGQTSRENLQRAVGTNVITGAQAQFPFQVSLLANLKAITVSALVDQQVVSILGYTSVGDNGGGQFQYVFASTATPNDTTVVLPNSGTGRWLRISYIGLSALSTTLTGTSNQVLVNGTSGSAQTGAMTLTTPQSIGTTSTPRFARLGIGADTVTTSDVLITHSVPTGSAAASVVVQGGLTAPAATDLHPNAYRDTTGYTSTVDADAYASFDAQASLGGTHAYNHFIGYQARQNYAGSGTLGRLEGFTSNMTVTSGTVTEARGFYVPDLIYSGGTITHFAGLYIDQLTRGTTRHAVYIAGTDDIFMGGGQITTSALLAPITTGSRLSVTFAQGSSQTGIDVMNSTATYTGSFINFYHDAATLQGSITQTNSTTTAYNTSSDLRLKENVRDMTDSGAVIDGIRPRIFDWRWGGKNYHGFIAQELYEAYPEAVTKGTDELDKKGNPVSPWQVDFAKLVPVLVAEVKSLRARVEALEKGQAVPAALTTETAIPTDAKGAPINR